MLTRTGLFTSSTMLLVGLALAAPGCAIDPSAEESTSNANQAQTKTKDVTLTTDSLALVGALYGLSDATVKVDNGAGTFFPSAKMKQLLYPDPAKQPVDPNVHFTVPDFPISKYGVTFHVSITHLELLGPARIEINDSHLDVFASATGTLHASSSIVNPDYVVDRLDVQARFVVGAGGALSIESVNPTLAGHMTGCGAWGWCNGIGDSIVASQASGLGSPVQSALAQELAKPEAQGAWFGFLDAWANALPDGPPWHTDRSSVRIANDEMDYTATRVMPPDPPVCSYSVMCNDAVTMHCSGSWVVGATITNGDGSTQYANTGWDYSTGSMKMTWGGTLQSSPSQTAQVCSSDSDGENCINVNVKLPHIPCPIRVIPPIPIPHVGGIFGR